MSKRINDIQDDDFRIIGATPIEAMKVDKSKSRSRWYIYVIAAAVCLAGGLVFLLTRGAEEKPVADNAVVFDPMPMEPEYSVEEEENSINVEINGKDAGFLIGYTGEVLNSLQNILLI